jgi:clathrin heavy chain
MWKDCIDTANESADAEIIETLLRFFCETSEKECFCATLYTCFSHVRPDVALELGWLNGYQHFIMPFLIQNMRQTFDRLKALEDRTKPPKEQYNVDEVAQTYGQLGGFNNMLMLENGGGMGMPGMGMPQGGGIDMSGFPNQGGMPPQMQPGMMQMNGGGMPMNPGMMPNGGMY